MPTDKDQLHALLADYVEGSLDERQIDEAEAYLNANPAVRTVVERLMVDSEMLRALPQQRSPVDYSEDVRAAAERDGLLGDAASAAAPRRPISGPMLALAAMLMVGLGLGGAAWWMLSNRPTTSFDLATTAGREPAPASAPAARELAADDAPRANLEPMTDRAATPDELAARRELAENARARAVRAGDDKVALAPAMSAPMTPGVGADMERTARDIGRATGDAGIAATPAPAAAAPGADGGGGANATLREWPPELEVAAKPAESNASAAELAESDATPPAVRAVVDAAPAEGGRTALAIAVEDVGDVEPMRRLVRAIVAPQHLANNVYENVGPQQNVLAATLPVDLGPLVAVDVPAQSAARLRAAIDAAAADGGPPPARVYEVTRAVGAKADEAEEKTKDADEGQAAQQRAQASLQRQQISGEWTQRAAGGAMAKAMSPNVDVYVILAPTEAAATKPAVVEPTTAPAE